MAMNRDTATRAHTSSPSPAGIVLCVGAVVVREATILFVRQTYGSLRGKWSLPWGFAQGRADDGSPEPPDVAAVRETYEEAGICASVEGLLGIQNHVGPDGEARLYLLFLCRHISGEPMPDRHETDRAAYLSLEEMSVFGEPIDAFCLWHAQRVLRGTFHLLPGVSEHPYHPYVAFV